MKISKPDPAPRAQGIGAGSFGNVSAPQTYLQFPHPAMAGFGPNKSKVLFIFCLCFIAGIAVHSILSPDKRVLEPFTLYVLFLACAFVGIVLYYNPTSPPLKLRGGWEGLFLALFLLGFFRYAQVIPVIDEHHILHYVGQEITIRGVVDALPRKREKITTYLVKLQNLQGQSLFSRTILEGKLLVAVDHFSTYQYGDLLAITCTPEPLNEYEQYFRRDRVTASCAFPSHIMQITPLRGGTPPLSGVKGVLYQIREAFHVRLQSLFSDPHGALLSGLLYGDTSGFSKELKENFRATGISHITALSGYNVSIISDMLIAFLITLWLTRKQALPIAFFLVILFVILTGAEASVVRAAIMGFLLMGANGIGRMSKAHRALALVGAIMLAINPYLLRFDLGFQLSFLATIALIWFSNDLAKHTWMRYLPKFLGIRKAGAASAAAILFTAPLLFYTTGMLGPLSLLTNILVVPIVPFVMGVGFIAVAADFLFHPLGLVISWLARVPLGYIIGVAEYFSRFGAWHWKMDIITAGAMFGIIVLAVWQWKKKLKYVQTNTSRI